ncbi:MAG TPA: EAL domain-containing protein [Trebonia sp.]|nr:EAL domain-containing protein [Trebonia sp.]
MTVLAVFATLATAAAAVGLWVGARRHRSTIARGYRWLSGAALFWCAGLILQAVLAGALNSSGAPSLADVAPLLALVATAVGIMVLASPAAVQSTGADSSTPGTPGTPGTRGPVVPVSVLPGLADGYVTAVSLLVIGWVVAFGAEYHTAGGHPGSFLLDLLHPLADLAVLGALLPVLTVAWQRTLLPYLALVAATGADSLGVGARVSQGHEGVLQQLAMIAAAFLLGAAPWVKTVAMRLLPVLWYRDGETVMGMAMPGTGPAGEGTSPLSAPVADQADTLPDVPGAGTGGGMATVIAAITAGIAAIFVIIHGLASAPASDLALVIAGGAAVLVVVVRVLMLVRENAVAVRLWRHSGSSLRDLADRTSDMVLICDLDGTITYASPGGMSFSYPQEELVGRRLAEFVHPEDIPVARFVIREALGLPFEVDPVSLPDAATTGQVADEADAVVPVAAEGAQAARGRLSCRLRTADGTWRHVECAVLLYQVPGEPTRMLITARDVSDEVALRQQVAHLTFHDGLTGLPSRAYLEDRVRGALPDMPDMAGLIFLDLDGFTLVNDSAGHGAGDVVLAQAARRLRAAVPARDTVARWGGDEFAVLVETAAGQEITELAERLAEAIAGEPFRVTDREVALSASVGAALVSSSERTPDLLLRNADVAMARAKAAGGNRVELYAEYMHADVVRRMELASDLKRAIDRGDLTLVYQPVIELATSRVIGVEAYVQLRRADEDIEPRELLAVAEDCGLSGALGERVLRTACAQGEEWRAAGWDVIVAVNLSARQLTAPRLPTELAGVLAETGLDPSALAIELSERTLLEQADQVAGRLAELRGLGVRLAIDDLGTGYASLAHLRELPVDIIKIAPFFVAGLGHDPTLTLLTRTITQVGRDLGIEVIAEGVEQPRQLTELTEMGCRYGQGLLLGRPMTASAVEALFRDTSTQPPRARVSKAGAA